MTQDVTALAGVHPLTGFLSSLGVLLWCVAASICFFAAWTLRNSKPGDIFWFLLFSALLSAYFLFDDLFQFHEELAYRYLGLKEKTVTAALLIAVFAYLIFFRRIILRTNFSILLSALGFFTTSVVIDQWLSHKYFFEDGAKWLGIASWCSYFTHTSYLFLASAFNLPASVFPACINNDQLAEKMITNPATMERFDNGQTIANRCYFAGTKFQYYTLVILGGVIGLIMGALVLKLFLI